MPSIHLLLLFWCTTFLFAQEKRFPAEESVLQKIRAAYAREERATAQLNQLREQLRQQMPTSEAAVAFDAFFSGLVKKDRSSPSFPDDLQARMKPIIPLDSLQQIVADWQKSRIQNLRLVKQHLTPALLEKSAGRDTSVLLQYLTFFNIQPAEKVAELGAGSGWLSLLLAILYEDIQLYVNELGSYNLQQAQANLGQELTKAQLSRCFFATGSKNTTGLEMENVNLMIAVDAFHHFNDKASMLQSIKWSLAKGGRFCLVEQVKNIQTGDDYCPQALEKWELEALLQQNGFVKMREQRLIHPKNKNIYLLEYAVNPL